MTRIYDRGRRRLWIPGLILGAVVGAAIAGGTLFARTTRQGNPATMGNDALAAYIEENLTRQGVPVSAAHVSGDGTELRAVAIELETDTVYSINNDIPQIMNNIATAIQRVREQGAQLGYYSVVLRDKAGSELLMLEVDLVNQEAHSRQDPRLNPLWKGPLPKGVYENWLRMNR